MTTPPLGVAVVGVGVGRQHALAYAARPDCRLRWICDLERDRAEAVARETAAGAVTGRYQDILDDGETAIVSIASFDDAHFGQVMAALPCRKHLFVEKPLCRTLAELTEIKRAWAAAGHPALESNLVLRAAPLYRWLKAAVAAGELGEIYAIDGEYLYGRLHKVTEGWRKDIDDYSVLLGGGIHLLDLMLWLAGERPERVQAVGNRICSRGTAFRYHDFAAATFAFPSGLVGRLTGNYGCVHRHHHVLRLYGTRATFIYDDTGARLHRSRDPQELAAPVVAAPLPAAKGDLIPDFIALVRSGADTTPTAQRNFDLVSAGVAAEAALLDGRERTIAYV